MESQNNQQPIGQAAAAQLNRQQAHRNRIITALRARGIPEEKWPTDLLSLIPEMKQTVAPPPFLPPNFERLHQSIEEWEALADAEWNCHKKRFIAGEQFWVDKGIDERIPKARRVRGPGVGRKRKTAPIEKRYDWVARRIGGGGWKEISSSHSADAVRKAVTQIFQLAGLPAKTKRIPRNAPVQRNGQRG